MALAELDRKLGSMPSQLHEALVLLFRNRPALAVDLLRESLRIKLPPYSEVRIDSAELTEVQPAEYRADLVILLADGVPTLGVVLEVRGGARGSRAGRAVRHGSRTKRRCRPGSPDRACGADRESRPRRGSLAVVF